MEVRVLSWASVVGSCLLIASLPAKATTFPLRVDPSGRSLVDAADVPFRIQGDSAWDLAVQLGPAEVDHYLEVRARQGFNSLLILFIEHKRWVSSSKAPLTRDGIAPFSKAGDFSTPNDAYFQRVADVVERAGKHGFLVLGTPLYLGFVGRNEGWWNELNAEGNTRAVCHAFGEYLAHGRGGAFHGFKDAQNLVWVQGGDFFPPPGSEGAARAQALMDGLRAGGATQLQTGHWSEEHIATDQPDFAPAMDLEAVYTYGPNHDGQVLPQLRRAYAYHPARPPHALPAFLIETQYESSGWLASSGATRQLKRMWWSVKSFFGTPPPKITRPSEIRRLMYQAQLSTGGGVFYGNEQVWMFGDDWADALETVGARDMQVLFRLMDSVQAFSLIPSGLGALAGAALIAGRDDPMQGGEVAAAASADRTRLVAYVPAQGAGPRTFSVRALAIDGPPRARWFDPSSGDARAAAAGTQTHGYLTFTTPGANAGGDSDWVLVLEREPGR